MEKNENGKNIFSPIRCKFSQMYHLKTFTKNKKEYQENSTFVIKKLKKNHKSMQHLFYLVFDDREIKNIKPHIP